MIIEANDKINKLQTNIDELSKANNEISCGQEENVREFREFKQQFDKSRKFNLILSLIILAGILSLVGKFFNFF